ncbi:hypothetical protein DM02DRAFT_656812 [Periconia macrospinosa]|uniref:RING-type domain-containing protein n=1 Tax=Periconia macrospinosa TaxID=97972 RepID=A0A2V1DMG0_9PLEO|nr:hypothetical protein DM02DRAFT_656812 [Periconia macrospinosa]
MPPFDCVVSFLDEGVEHVPSPPTSADCPVCKEQYIEKTQNLMQEKQTSPEHQDSKNEEEEQAEDPSEPHTAVRIVKCGHVFGLPCLGSWIVSHNTCPYCRDVLFDQMVYEAPKESWYLLAAHLVIWWLSHIHKSSFPTQVSFVRSQMNLVLRRAIRGLSAAQMADLVEIAAEEWRVHIEIPMSYEALVVYLRTFDGDNQMLSNIKRAFGKSFFRWYVDVLGLTERLHMEAPSQ